MKENWKMSRGVYINTQNGKLSVVRGTGCSALLVSDVVFSSPFPVRDSDSSPHSKLFYRVPLNGDPLIKPLFLCSQAQVNVLRSQVDTTPMPVFAQTLLEEKNAEIDELTAQVAQLQQNAAEGDAAQQVRQLVSGCLAVHTSRDTRDIKCRISLVGKQSRMNCWK